jgi:hypothetical protein
MTTMIALMMEAVSTSETPVNFYETTRRNIPEGFRLQKKKSLSLIEQIKDNVWDIKSKECKDAKVRNNIFEAIGN